MRLFLIIWVALVTSLSGQVHADTPQELYKQLFGDEVRQVKSTRDTTDDLELANRLINSADTLKDNPQFKLLLTQEAVGYYVSASEYDDALEVIVKLKTLDPEHKQEWENQTLTICQKRYQTAEPAEKFRSGEAYMKVMLKAVDSRIQRGDYLQANHFLQRGLVEDRRMNMGMRNQLLDKIKHVNSRIILEKKLKALENRFEMTPTDTTLASQIMQLYLVEFNDPISAAVYAKAADDEATLAMLVLAQKKPRQYKSDEPVKLASWYEQLSKKATKESKVLLLTKAHDCLSHYLSRTKNAGDLDAMQAKLKRDAISKQLAKIKPIGAAIKKLNLLRIVQPKTDSISGKWAVRNGKLYCTTDDDRNQIKFPAKIQGSYQLTLKFTTLHAREVTYGRYMSLILPVGNKRTAFTYYVSYDSPALSVVNPPKTRPNLLRPGAGHIMLFKVEKIKKDQAKVTISIDGAKVIQWAGNMKDVRISSMDDHNGNPNPEQLEINFYRMRCIITEMQITMLDGKIIRLH